MAKTSQQDQQGDIPDFTDDDMKLADEAQDDNASESDDEDDDCECGKEIAQQAHDIIAQGDPQICHPSGEHDGDSTLRLVHDFLVTEGAVCPGMTPGDDA